MSSPEADILLVAEVFPPAIGGSGTLLENLYCRLAGLEVHVLTHGRSAPHRQRGLLVESVEMDAPSWGVLQPASLRRHMRVARAIGRARRRRDTVLHCAKALPEGLSARLSTWRRPAPYVCWIHGEELGHASTSRELHALARLVYKGAAALIANSQNSRRILVSDWGVAESRVHVIHPGVDVSRFTPDVDGSAMRARIGVQPADLLLLSVGRLDRRKGHDMALRALARLRGQQPSIRYAIVGDGPQRASLEALAADEGVSDLVHFVGAVEEADLPAWYAASDVFLMPNRTDGVDFEGFGIVFLEAAAAGKPAIGGRSGGVIEAVADGATGLLVDGNDMADIADAILRLATDPGRRVSLGRAGRQRVQDGFTWSTGAATLRALHQALTARETQR